MVSMRHLQPSLNEYARLPYGGMQLSNVPIAVSP